MKILINDNPQESLGFYLQQNAGNDTIFYLISPLPSTQIFQRGETCKLYALANAINQEASKQNIIPLPLYKNKMHAQVSLRQLAKKNGSSVGEMYSIESMVKTAHDAGFSASVFAPNNEFEYINCLKEELAKNKAPIVFFDLDSNPGLNFKHPYIGNGNNEHAAVVVGCYDTYYGDTHFIVMQYNEFYDFGGWELALSSMYSLNDKRNVETFRKVEKNNTTMWVLDNAISSQCRVIEGVSSRVARPMSDMDTPLKGKIISVSILEYIPIDYCFFAQNGGNFSANKTSPDKTTYVAKK